MNDPRLVRGLETARDLTTHAQRRVDLHGSHGDSPGQGLPRDQFHRQEVKTVILEVAADYRDELAAETNRRAERSTKEYLERGGQILTLSDEQRREWAMGLPNIAQDWADDMEARGMPGNAILKDYMEIMRANDQPIVRHWDRE